MLNYSKISKVFFIVVGVLFFTVMSKDTAGASSPYWNTQSWSGTDPILGPVTISFSTPDGPLPGSQNYFSCTSASDRIFTTGVPSTWTLEGLVTVSYFGYSQVPNGSYPVAQSGNLDLTVFYPPANAWPGGTNTRVIIVNISITVRDSTGAQVLWVGSNGILGPGQIWNVSCLNPPLPSISITKYTNGFDANDPNGAGVPRIPPGGTATWTYQVTNTGTVPVAQRYLYVTDYPSITPTFAQELSGNGDLIFDPGEVWKYSATGQALDLSVPQPGVTTVPNSCTANKTMPPSTAYVNTGTVSPEGGPSSSDVSSYCNPPPNVAAISVIKYVSVDNQATWYDANTAPGPTTFVNTNVFFKFVVTNVGSFTLSPITLTDDTYSTSSCTTPPSMAPSASFNCVIGPFLAQLGQHTNTATVTSTYNTTVVSDHDVANYFAKKYYLWLPIILK